MSPLLARSRTRELTADQLTLAWQSASLLLAYPDPLLLDRLDLVRLASAELPDDVGQPLRRTVSALERCTIDELEAGYVDTFDNRRRHNLFLTYFAHGDTRKRGVALLRFKQTYRSSGFELDTDELPDHLCVVLEYAATIDREQGRRLLLDHRAGLELLRLALVEDGSRWAGAVEAVTATFPPLQGHETEAIRRLAAEGPPEEEVGLTPYGEETRWSSLSRPDATLSEHRTAVDLPMPTVRGGV
jgi:nitrate reductase molybdenum cofactor assembly chaperone NarJ/NarW